MNHKALHKIGYGMYVVSSKKGDKFNGQIANAVFQVTANPKIIAVSISKKNYTHEFITQSKLFTLSVLAKETPMKFIGHFGFKCGRDLDKFKGINYKIVKTGAPIVTDNAIAWMEAEVINSIDVETHTIFIGKVIDADVISDAEGMTYCYYHEVKHGKSPKNAPTYIKDEILSNKEESKMPKYRCKTCGYIYDPAIGDPEASIKPGTSFDDLPDDWVCPTCGVGKEEFEKEA